MQQHREREKDRRLTAANKRQAQMIEAAAHRICVIVTKKHDHRLVGYKREDLLHKLAEDGATGSRRRNLDELNQSLDQALASGEVWLSTDEETGQVVLETERPKPPPVDQRERITEQFETGGLLQPRHRQLLTAWGHP